ncbi:MAG: alpha/beta fold hydrolase [Desulfatibacillaceae bacterium]|nr:alpha/beta fold hydrolase [Desulfatibacillaceae bacterium]
MTDKPDWGTVEDTIVDTRSDARDGGLLEVWRVWPDGEVKGLALLAHGWTRNRDKMTPRARNLGQMGFVTVLPSFRDHGHSSKYAFASVKSFADDIETLLRWLNQPVILYGHSAGAGAAMLAAVKNPSLVRLLILEGCYANTRKALWRLYMDMNRVFGIVLGPGLLLWAEILSGFTLGAHSPSRLAPKIDVPVLIVHGQLDEKFPVRWARQLEKAFPPGSARVYINKNTDHTQTGETPQCQEAVKKFVERCWQSGRLGA